MIGRVGDQPARHDLAAQRFLCVSGQSSAARGMRTREEGGCHRGGHALDYTRQDTRLVTVPGQRRGAVLQAHDIHQSGAAVSCDQTLTEISSMLWFVIRQIVLSTPATVTAPNDRIAHIGCILFPQTQVLTRGSFAAGLRRTALRRALAPTVRTRHNRHTRRLHTHSPCVTSGTGRRLRRVPWGTS